MIVKDQTLDRLISANLLRQNEEEQKNHKSSGKLSASMLNWPLQWQILKAYGIDQKPFDEYTLRKFTRGKHVEDWLVGNMKSVVDTQKFVSYKDCIGYADAVVNSNDWEHKVGIIPHEVKSVTNQKFKYIVRRNEADMSHILQATLYGMALNSEWFAIDYVASDDYRVETFVMETKTYAGIVEQRIAEYNEQLKTGIIPKFEPREDWQSQYKYCNYPDWMDSDEVSFDQYKNQQIEYLMQRPDIQNT